MREIIVDLPAFGIADQADVGEQLQLEPQILLFAGQPGLGPCAARGWWRSRTRVAVAAEAALGDQHALAVGREVRDLRVRARRPCFSYTTRADRHLELDVVAVLAGAVRALAVRAAAGVEDFLEAEIEEGVEVGVGDEVDRAAVAAVAAARAAARDELLAAEAMAPRPPWPAATWMSTSSTNTARTRRRARGFVRAAALALAAGRC